MPRALLLGAAAALAGCAATAPPRPPSAVASTSEDSPHEVVVDTADGAAPSPEPAPGARVRLDAGRRELTAVVEVVGPEPARLAGRMRLEREGESGWVEVAEAATDLRAGCGSEAEPEACVELVPGAELRTPLSAGTGGAGAGCPRLTPGRYRAVVRSCGGQHVLRSDAITR